MSIMDRLVIQDDCIECMRAMAESSVDAIVTDPPYGIGFMGKKWDGLPPGVEWAEQCLRVLKPGGHLLAFGGTRTYHRLACAIEDAGFEIRDCIQWLYGSGFPKSQNVAKTIDKAGVAGADEWEGWGTALKPANEPIVVARKPLAKRTVASNVIAFGTGALNIDACRVGTTKDVPASVSRTAGTSLSGSVDGSLRRETGDESGHNPDVGRWPANVILDEEAAAILDEQTGTLTSGKGNIMRASGSDRNGNTGAAYGAESRPAGTEMISYGDSGGASRFFYCPKASTKERSMGLDQFPDAGRTDDGYGTIQQPKLDRVAPRENWTPHPVKNNHPTVKPISLMRYLCRLVTPPDGLVLDPFTGSGTTGIAAVLEGFRFTGIEREHEYAQIARARIEHAAQDAEVFAA